MSLDCMNDIMATQPHFFFLLSFNIFSLFFAFISFILYIVCLIFLKIYFVEINLFLPKNAINDVVYTRSIMRTQSNYYRFIRMTEKSTISKLFLITLHECLVCVAVNIVCNDTG